MVGSTAVNRTSQMLTFELWGKFINTVETAYKVTGYKVNPDLR